jgi:flagellar P-ring protein precursor FlgI
MMRRLVLAAVAVLGLQTAYADGPDGVPAAQFNARAGQAAGGNAGEGSFDTGKFGDSGNRLTSLNGGIGTHLVNVRIKDIASLQESRDNQLVGYGLVIGLNGSGDSLRNAHFT